MANIVLSTINAKYIHASLGLRYLLANMGELKKQTQLLEFTLHNRTEDIVEQLLQTNPRIVGFGVYIWNSTQTLEVVCMLKLVKPELTIVLGGPEISFETTGQELYKVADHVIIGQADHAFRETCEQILGDEKEPASKLISPLPFDLKTLQSPYPEYTSTDLKNRVLYVEASRGCPFKCEFCLSSLDKTVTAFDLEQFLSQMSQLVERGARHFKFVDRTFNLKTNTSRSILEFFLIAIETDQRKLFLHFELIPDRLPNTIKELLPRFPDGCLQFEIGIQSFNTEVQKRISRKQQHDTTCENIRWLRANTKAHIHADLIFGLPGESIESFGQGFDLLLNLGPQEIQVGILKRLRGTPIARHTQAYDMRYQATPPYRILSNADVSFDTVQRIVRFSRYWDLIANSGRFPNSLPLMLGQSAFDRFLSSSDWIFAHTGQTHKISLPKLFTILYQLFINHLSISPETAKTALSADFKHNKLKGRPKLDTMALNSAIKNNTQVAKRQTRHLVEHH